jgi:hypothetical protein
MQCFAIQNEQAVPTVEFPQCPKFVSNKLMGLWSNRNEKLLMNPETFVGLELSLVPQVEAVYVIRVGSATELKVTSVTNERDPEVRSKVYAREQAIIDAYPNLNFDFNVIARRNRDLDEVFTQTGTLAFKR